MASNLLSTVLSGMNAAQLGMATTQHNIANASTPGFSRQQVQTSSRGGQQTGAGFIGQGVDVAGIRRVYDQFLNTQVMQEQNQDTYLSTYLTAMKQIDNLIADPTAGASPAIQEFFSAMNGVVNNPGSAPARQTLLSAAQFVANRFQAIDQRMADIANGINGQITGSVNTINTYAQQIATLNDNIKFTSIANPGQPPNDLLDQRDQLLNELNKEIKVSVISQSDGGVNVFIGNGQSLVIGSQAMSLRTIQSASDPNKVEVAYNSGINVITLQQNNLQGGKLGAYIAFRDQSLEPARNSLGRVAMVLADSVNQQNQLGQDLNGAAGGNIFNTSNPQVIKNANNSSAAEISATISDVSALTTSDYQLSFDGANYSMVRLSDNAVTSLGPALPQTVDGFTVDLASGAPDAGDSFLIRPTANGARDINVAIIETSKIAAAAPVRTMATLTNSGSGKISSGTVDAPPPPNLNLKNSVTVTFVDATHFTVDDNTAATTLVGLPGTTYNPAVGATLSFNGWTAQITGTPAAGDTFSIASNTNATGDNRNALLMVGLQSMNLVANGAATLQGAYGQLIGEVGAKTHELDVTSQAQSNMLAQTVASQQAVSGVNLDEEAANLLQYQRAYQAAAKAIQVANTMFDTLLSTIGR